MKDEVVFEENLSSQIYNEEEQEEEKQMHPILVDPNNKGYQLEKGMGFTGKGGLGLNEQVMREHIIMEKLKNNL